MRTKTRRLLGSVHKWLGLLVAIWVLILGLTGLMLDHRDDWGWAWRTMVPDSLLPARTVDALKNRHITLAQVNPQNKDEWLVAGPVGIWHSQDATNSWQRLEFEGLNKSPMVFTLILDADLGWKKVWMATDDGLWSFQPESGGNQIRYEGLKGRYLTALDNGSSQDSLVMVEGRSDILFWSKSRAEEYHSVSTDEVMVTGLPEKVSWSRFLFDMHLGRAFFDRPYSMMINDFGAIAFVVLSLTGFLQWLFLRRWRKKKAVSAENATKRAGLFKSLYNLHAPLIGLLAILPIFYLAFTGIIMDHRNEWMMPLVLNKIDRDALPPVYQFSSLSQEISHIVAYPDDENKLTVGTRLGVLTTIDTGSNWTREEGESASPGFVWSLKREGDYLFLGGLGGPSYVRELSGTKWSMIPGLMGMPSDATVSDNTWYVISGPSMFSGGLFSGMTSSAFNLPTMNARPLMLLMFEIHNGGIIGHWMKYVLDLVCIFLIVMLLTGPILWWRRKWWG